MSSFSLQSPSPKRRSPETARQFWLDLACRLVVGGFFAFSAASYMMHALKALHHMGGMPSTLEQAVDVASILATTFFVGFIAYLYAIRLRPVSQFAGWIPALTALLGSFLPDALVLLPLRTDHSIAVKLTSTSLIFIGNILAIYALRYLGRSFSILPQGRSLVTSGPYRYIRHPVYVAESFATLGVMINFLSPWAVAIVVAQLSMQLTRMHFEEKVLLKTFPESKNYIRQTARLIPGLY